MTQDLQFEVTVDGVNAPLGGVSCVPASDASECTAPLPPMRPGLHTLTVSAVDASGNQSASSDLLTILVPSSDPVAPALASGTAMPSLASSVSAAQPRSPAAVVPPQACAGKDCYLVSVLARGQGTVGRLEPLGEDQLLILRDSRDILSWRAGAIATAYDVRQDDRTSSTIADMAVDPDFARNRFVYLAVVTGTPPSASVRLVRLREAGGRFAEAATIVPDLPVSGTGTPRITMTADRHLYLAMPGTAPPARPQPYDGQVLAFTHDGASAGVIPGSPTLAQGAEWPAVLHSAGTNQVWLGAQGPAGAAGLRLMTAPEAGTPRAPLLIDFPELRHVGVRDVALVSPDRGVLVTSDPQALFVFRVLPDATMARQLVDLQGLAPSAVAVLRSGEIVVSASDVADPGSVVILNMRPLEPAN